jgi:AraC-like DNA-binding protein
MTFHPDTPSRERLRLAPDCVPSTLLHGIIRLPGRVEKVMGRLVEQQRSGSERERLLSRTTLYELLVELLLPEEALTEGQAGAERLAARVRRLLDEVAARPEPVPAVVPLLESLGRSYAHLCRLFRQEYGISPLRYVHAARMGRARLLLAEGRLGVAEIAYRLGYEDPGHFTRVFRTVTGTTPTEFQVAHDRS